MSDISISAEHVSKRYRIGTRKSEGSETLGGTLMNLAIKPVLNLRDLRKLSRFGDGQQAQDIIWALRDVSVQVEQGEVLGLIGKNGAGKSTFLKILSRIADPTEGVATINGRVGSLLEVGTGFHPELTGRENVFLNGTLLGMTRPEIKRKFDEIVEFAEVEQFIDTPVKRYSTGMKVRLAFAVAAHLEPEILLVDEVLAVGDVAFQNKCLGKMDNVANEGRTVIFVSHNMGAITRLCSRAIWFESGRIRQEGHPSLIVASYLAASDASGSAWVHPDTDCCEAEAKVKSARVLSTDGQPVGVIPFVQPFMLEIDYEVRIPTRHVSVHFQVIDPQGTPIWTSMDTDTTAWEGSVREVGHYRSTCQVPGGMLRPGHYYISLGYIISRGLRTPKRINHDHVIGIDISEEGYYLNTQRQGIITPMLDWQVTRLSRDPRVNSVETPDPRVR